MDAEQASEPFTATADKEFTFTAEEGPSEPFAAADAEQASEPFTATEDKERPFTAEEGPSEPFAALDAEQASEPFTATADRERPFTAEEGPSEPFAALDAEQASEPFTATADRERPFTAEEGPSEPFAAADAERASEAFTAMADKEFTFTAEEAPSEPFAAADSEQASEAFTATADKEFTFTAEEPLSEPFAAADVKENSDTSPAEVTEPSADTEVLEHTPEETEPSVSESVSVRRATRRKRAPTLWQRLFGRSKARKNANETVQDSEPRSISLEEVVGNTVDAVKADSVSRRSLFSRQRLEDTEESPDTLRPEIIGPEPDLKTAAEEARKEYVKRIEGLLPALPPALLPLFVLILEALGVRLPLLTGNVILRPFLLLACIGATLWLCRSVFTDNRCTGTFLCGVSAVAAGLDCLTMLFLPGRSMAEPYGAVTCLALLAAKLGSSLESHGTYDTFHTAGLDRNPPYLVTDTVRGTSKQRGAVTGFYTAALEQNFSTRWQTLALPIILAASLVFAALSSIGQERGGDFFLNWSAILTAGATLVLPFCWGLPWARLASRLKKSGCAIAGWRGAEQMSRKKKMIVTDSDLFPPGSVRLEDVRLYEEEMRTVVSITASMIRESGCGLERIFDDLLKSESGEYLSIRDFHFYEDGGFSGAIGEDSILLGTSSFLRKMSVRFPGDFYFPMGLYLSVNGELTATFALKYVATETVDLALRLMRRNRVTAILAARDPNLTPKLLHRVFRRRIDVEYPGLNNRIALSAERTKRDLPRGLLFREGLPPYAEIVVGSLRLCAGVRRSTRLALFGSAVGTLLSFYLVYQAKYYLLSPLNLLLFLVLWTIPTVLLMDLS